MRGLAARTFASVSNVGLLKVPRFSTARATFSYLRFAGWARTGTDGRGQTGLLSVRFQERKVDPGGLLRPPAEGPLAEGSVREVLQNRLRSAEGLAGWCWSP